ncbi:hypothetical protein [Halopseudomonas oceani]|uniref:hypothetical protein n=1 Tax=Halopseudomonas oceani TaxID=1708783 RepID=UPI002AA6A09E|nr:hypothetical protein [Halopseudomonas oceani]
MPIIDCCGDGMYYAAGEYHVLESLAAVAEPPGPSYRDSTAAGEQVQVHPFRLETPHGVMRWVVEVVEYEEPKCSAIKGFSLISAPAGIALIAPLAFTLLDGHA